MRFAFYGLLLAVVLLVVTGGHLIFLPLFFALPLGGLFGHRAPGGGRVPNFAHPSGGKGNASL